MKTIIKVNGLEYKLVKNRPSTLNSCEVCDLKEQCMKDTLPIIRGEAVKNCSCSERPFYYYKEVKKIDVKNIYKNRKTKI